METNAFLNATTQLQLLLNTPWYKQPGVIIPALITLAGAIFSAFAFVEARRAKHAATEAGTTVKIQTLTIELTEVVQRLDSLDVNIDFPTTRDLLNEISRRIRRLISPFESQPDLSKKITELKNALDEAKEALNDVRPSEGNDDQPIPHAVYYATESYFSAISGLLADLMGLFEKRTIDLGE